MASKPNLARLDWQGYPTNNDGRWRMCSPVHYQTTLDGDLLDYWPSTSRWRWRGESFYGRGYHGRRGVRKATRFDGDVTQFIRQQERAA